MIHQFHSWIYIWKKWKHSFEKIYAPQLSQQHFIIAKTRKQPKCPSTEHWIKKMWDTHIQYYSAIKKMKYCHLQQCGWTWRLLCSVKFKLDRKRQILYDITTCNLKNHTNDSVYKTETDSQIKKINLFPKRRQWGSDKLGIWN